MLATAAPQQVLAHVPSLEPAPRVPLTPVPIGGPQVSRAVYGYLSDVEEYDEYEFFVPKGMTRTVGVLVPAYSEHADFRPTILVSDRAGWPLEIADPGESPRVREWEPFSLTAFWVGGEREVRLEPGQDYRLRVYPGDGDSTGRYVVVFGGPEGFTSREALRTPLALPRIWFGAYGGAPWRWNWYPIVPIVILLGVLLAMILVIRTAVHRHSLAQPM